MKLDRSKLINLVKEVFEDEKVQSEMTHAAEKLARSLQQQYGDEGAIKVLIYAADIVKPGMYQPSTGEKEEFMQEPFPGSRKKLGGTVSLSEDRLSSYWKRRAAMRARKGKREFPNKIDREWARAQQTRSSAVQSAFSVLHPQSVDSIEEAEEDINEKFAEEFLET